VTTYLKDYQDKYRTAHISRDEKGVIEVRLHTDDGPLVWGETAHREMSGLFGDIADDRENRVMVLTGSGDRFIADMDSASLAGIETPIGWDKIFFEGRRMLRNLLDIECPIIAAINGPSIEHAEIGLLSDIVLCSDNAVFRDGPHFANGLVPGDGVNLLFPLLMGLNRAKYFLLMGQELDAQQALEYGLVNEVHTQDALLPRAREIAQQFALKPTLALKYTRIALMQSTRKLVLDQLGYGLAMEGNALMSIGTENFDYLPKS